MPDIRKRALQLKNVMSFLCLWIAVAAVIAAMLAGCAVGPDFRAPAAPTTNVYTAAELPAKTASAPGFAGTAQQFVPGQDIQGEWWVLFHSETLDRLIRQALADSPTLAAAKARLREAQENRRAGLGALFPSVDANASASRQKISGASIGQPDTDISTFNLFNTSVNVSYALDLFGGTRRILEALQSQIDYQQYQLEGAYLTLTSNIVTTAVQEASLRAQIIATQNIVALQEKQLGVVENQFRLGGASRADILAQQTQLAQTRATLPPLEKALAQTRHLLALLTGRLPHEAAGLPEFSLTEIELPQELPVSLPSSLVRQRPDIMASEALYHAACAQVGVATAYLYPQITLTGSYGFAAANAGDLFNSNSVIWSVATGVLQPIFHGGTLTAKRHAAIASYDEAAAQYRSTVLQAFQNVADVLRALETDARTLKAQADAEAAASDTLDLTQKEFQLGAVSYLSLLNAERQYQQSQVGLIQAQAARFADTAALFQALGGGWWNRSTENTSAQGQKESNAE
ncbi:MAG TPA: efflux transporter outer membrane subunit [Nitrospirota bacterium]|nr:efflux transporter outer membrane subunit [Nitrospirota bacterium]